MACPARIWRGGSLTTPNVAKETLAQVFPCEFCEISKNNFFYRTPLDDCFCKFKIL